MSDTEKTPHSGAPHNSNGQAGEGSEEHTSGPAADAGADHRTVEGEDHPDNTAEADDAPKPLLVGIGASAGGLEAINEFLDHYDDGCCILCIVQHQASDADREILTRLVGKHTKLDVVVAEDGAVMEQGMVYVAPPDKVLGFFDGKLQLTERQDHQRGMVIDAFFRSMADEAEERAVAIVLSGSNTDGTLGARAVKERNGLVIAQDPETADYPTMPASLVDEVLADLVLAPSDMPEHIKSYAKNMSFTPSPSAGQQTSQLVQSDRDKLLMLLKNRTGQDFSQYKDNTLNRRIQRRMNAHQLERLKDYVAYVRENSDEANLLFRDLLIGVTNFFRDPKSFEALKDYCREQVLPRIGDGKRLRAWVVGCSTGEEAYSLAMVLKEAADASKQSLDMNIYATDLDERAIEKARTGIFHRNIAADVSEERLQRFFLEQDDSYRIKPGIREMLVFAEHNIIKDPPFSNMDIVCCRNLLMYLKPAAQKKALAQFNYGLNPGGLLFLGTSESVSAFPGGYTVLDKKHRIYKASRTDAERRHMGRDTMPDFGTRQPHGDSPREHPKDAGNTNFKQAAERFLLEQCTSASVLVSRTGDILYYHGRTGRYLEPQQGPPQHNVHEMARKGLSYPLSTALSTAAAKGEHQLRRNVRVQTNGDEETIDLHVRPANLAQCDRPCFMVTFVALPHQQQEGAHADEEAPPEDARGRIQELEQELSQCREDMQAMTEEYEASNEELKSSNEELQSTNEELKSTNEELETTKEELQSINEEQTTLNSELQSKNDELTSVQDDMKNLLSSTRIATLFLAEDLHIRRFTPATKEIMSLRDADEGRPVSDIAMPFDYAVLEKTALAVLEDLSARSSDVRTRDGRWYTMRVNPYRTLENVIDGVVVTFTDITDLKRSEQEARHAQTFAESTLDTITEPFLVLDADLVVHSANNAFTAAFRVSKDNTTGKPLTELGDGQWDIPELRTLLEDVLPERQEVRDYEVVHEFPGLGKRRVLLNARTIPGTEEGEERMLLAFTTIEQVG